MSALRADMRRERRLRSRKPFLVGLAQHLLQWSSGVCGVLLGEPGGGIGWVGHSRREIWSRLRDEVTRSTTPTTRWRLWLVNDALALVARMPSRLGVKKTPLGPPLVRGDGRKTTRLRLRIVNDALARGRAVGFAIG